MHKKSCNNCSLVSNFDLLELSQNKRIFNFYPNKAEATPATAITIPPHLITD